MNDARSLQFCIVTRFMCTYYALTTSCVSSAEDCEDQISTLESLLASQACTVEDKTELEKTLDSFRRGEVNLLFTTDVAEEGIDIANCSYVIRFYMPKTVCSYVQARGRARQKGSQYIIMIESENMEQARLLEDIKRTDSSVSLIHRYCDKLPGDMYFTPKPKFHFTSSGGMFQCEMTLPPSAPVQRIVSPKVINMHLAKQLLCLEACRKLHESGALDDHLLPIVEEPLADGGLKTNKDYFLGAGRNQLSVNFSC
ncbi:Endoribonuclease dicer-like protein [Thalictrum thalictroides]|uniref:Endoribonuclease dicer-like protein n=1 Tax=Thalictrum thalictroides TaxID=46969 RepID=A0A7J6XBJ1_THATH|nr:Endoribonuclease dicer-like protein [Thalictrum thalictroides]